MVRMAHSKHETDLCGACRRSADRCGCRLRRGDTAEADRNARANVVDAGPGRGHARFRGYRKDRYEAGL